MWHALALAAFFSVATAGPVTVTPAGTTGGVITDPTITDVKYACRMGGGFSSVPRDPKVPIFVVRVVVGERVLYELYAKPRSQTQTPASVLLATCDYLVPVSE